MNETINIFRLRQPDEIEDPLTNVLRSGARKLLAQAIEMEAEAFLGAMKDLKLADGRDRIVRHGHAPERSIQTGIGPVPVSRVKIRDRGADCGKRLADGVRPEVPWHKRLELGYWPAFSDAGQCLGEPVERVNIVHFGRLEKRGQRRPCPSTALATGE
ncbi:hypothetical protein ACVIKO_000059 [Rhizobium ruizarguesonis]